MCDCHQLCRVGKVWNFVSVAESLWFSTPRSLLSSPLSLWRHGRAVSPECCSRLLVPPRTEKLWFLWCRLARTLVPFWLGCGSTSTTHYVLRPTFKERGQLAVARWHSTCALGARPERPSCVEGLCPSTWNSCVNLAFFPWRTLSQVECPWMSSTKWRPCVFGNRLLMMPLLLQWEKRCSQIPHTIGRLCVQGIGPMRAWRRYQDINMMPPAKIVGALGIIHRRFGATWKMMDEEKSCSCWILPAFMIRRRPHPTLTPIRQRWQIALRVFTCVNGFSGAWGWVVFLGARGKWIKLQTGNEPL